MNIQEIYKDATLGQLTVDSDGRPLAATTGAAADLLALQRAEEARASWLNNPQTVAFLAYLEKSANDLVEVASAAALTAETDLDIRLLMVQHNKLKEIIDYARRNHTSSSR